MNVLFYIEPLIQMDNPLLQKPWLYIHIKNIITPMIELKYNVYFVVNTEIEESLKKMDYFDKVKKVYSFKQEELKLFTFSTMELLEKWYNQSYSKDEIDKYKDIVNKKIGKISYDVIIAFSPVPYLKLLYPNALILYYEYGMFSRNPYSPTYYLDPEGPGGYSYISKNYDRILKKPTFFKKEKQIFLEKIKKMNNFVLKDNPFEEDMKKIKKSFQYLILLPLQFNNYYLFDLLSEYKTQFEYLEDVLIKTLNQNIGIVVTQHPANLFLNEERIEYFQKNYPNFIFIQKQKIYSCVSQMIIPYVDAVITVSSSIGYYALLWNKKLITLGKNYLNQLSDSETLENISDILKKPSIDRYKFLYWLMKYYFIPEKYIKNKNWLEKFFKHGIKAQNSKNIDFYQEIDTKLENITDIFFENEYLRLSNNLIKEYIQVFEDIGNGYLEEKSYKILKTFSEYSIISLELKMSEDVKSLRIDPLEDNCLIIIVDKNMEMIHNGREIYKNVYYFEHKDPQLIFFNKNHSNQTLKIKYEIWSEKNDILKILESQIQLLNNEKKELDNKIQWLRSLTSEKDKKMNLLEFQVNELMIKNQKLSEKEKELNCLVFEKNQRLQDLQLEINFLENKLNQTLDSKEYKLGINIKKILLKLGYRKLKKFIIKLKTKITEGSKHFTKK